MSMNLQRLLERKRALRQALAVLPITEKLRLLDELRARTMAIRGGAGDAKAAAGVSEPPAKSRPGEG
jgi:hypothetical protein